MRPKTSVIVSGALGACVIAFGALGVAAAPGAAGVSPPAAQIVGTPVLIAVKGAVAADRPTAYAFFTLSKHLHEPRLIVAQVDGSSGRTYAVRGAAVANCYKTALLLQGTPRGRLRGGSSYTLTFVSRRSAHQSTRGKKPFASFTVKAVARPLVHGTISGCPL